MKQWFTVNELAEMGLPGLPETQPGILKKAKSDGWRSQPRKASGGGREYHVSVLPEETQVALVERLAGFRNKEIISQPVSEPEGGDRSAVRRDAKLVILKHLELYRLDGGLTKARAVAGFHRLYNLRIVPDMPDWVYDTVSEVSERSLWRWATERTEKRFSALGKSQNNRAGTGVLYVAENGKIAEYIGALIVKQPHLKAGHIRDLCLAEFGDVMKVQHKGKAYEAPMPHLRSFARFIRDWRKTNAESRDRKGRRHCRKDRQEARPDRSRFERYSRQHSGDFVMARKKTLRNMRKVTTYKFVDPEKVK